jgi:Leucine-rich repeat (LRR) protein
MSVTITKSNINDFSKKIFNDITEITWNIDQLNKSIINFFPNLQTLDCNGNKIKSLESFANCVNLQTLNCCDNEIKLLKPLISCINLRVLNCSNNEIKSLKPLANCINLQILKCNSNHITSLNPIINCTNLRKLNCGRNQIKSLEPLANCISLEKIYCFNNQIISLDPLSNCINLQELKCSYCQIESLDPLTNCINLQILNCSCNQITLLNPLINCTNLRELYCYCNNITSLEPLAKCINLQELFCENNQITSLNALAHCININRLYCNHNQIISLDPLANCVNIQDLACENNQITSLECLVYLRRLYILSYCDNPFNIQSIQVQRFFDRFFIYSNKNNNIYQDKQNVHDVTIQKTVCESLQSLLKDDKPLFSINDIIASNLNLITKESLIEYCQDDSVHSVHLITYTELLGYVWQRIIKSEYKEELFKILEEQIAESECKCFTGRFNRTLSVLVGFFDDIKINISDNARIGAIIITCKEKIIPYNSYDHKKMVLKELLEAGYTEEEIKPWIEAIDDNE